MKKIAAWYCEEDVTLLAWGEPTPPLIFFLLFSYLLVNLFYQKEKRAPVVFLEEQLDHHSKQTVQIIIIFLEIIFEFVIKC